MSKVLHILMTDYVVDSRVRNETESLLTEGFDVVVACLKSSETTVVENRDGVNIKRFGVFNNKVSKLITAYLSMLSFGVRGNFGLVHCHDFTSLPVGYLIGKLKKIPVIYDSHELWSESHHGNYPKFILRCAYFFEKFLAHRVSTVITVSDSIKEYLKSYFDHHNVFTVRNIPSYCHTGEYNLLRESFGIPDTEKIFLYQGLLSENRGVLVILEAIKLCRSNIRFVFIGDGPLFEDIEKFININSLQGKVYLIPALNQSELLKYTRSADFGIHAISNSCLNHDYCLPNKIFEYLKSDIGIICTDLTEISRFVLGKEIGLVFKDGDSCDLANKIDFLSGDSDLANGILVNVKKINHEITWENESKEVLKIYNSLLIRS